MSDGDMLATKWSLRKNGELILFPVMKLGQGDIGLVTIYPLAKITGIILDTGYCVWRKLWYLDCHHTLRLDVHFLSDQ